MEIKQKTSRQSIQIPITGEDMVSGILDVEKGNDSGKSVVILAHGAGNDMTDPLLEGLVQGLAGAGFPTLRFNFPYKEKGKKEPDPLARLTRTWRSVYEFVKNEYFPEEIIAGGKSMGGRIASQMAADGDLPVDRLVFFGYPLHPPGMKDKLRDAHLYRIEIPMLFFAGTRDALCDLDLLRPVLQKLKGKWELEVIQGGDHSFRVLKSSGLSDLEVRDLIIKKTVDWLTG